MSASKRITNRVLDSCSRILNSTDVIRMTMWLVMFLILWTSDGMADFGSLSRVYPPASFPWSAVCRIVSKYPNGEIRGSSGILIDPKHLLTAAHCVYNSSRGGWATSITVTPSFDPSLQNSGAPFGEAGPIDDGGDHGILYWSDYLTSIYDEDDMAVIELDRYIGGLSGWINFGYAGDDFFSANNNSFEVAGFPGKPNPPYTGSEMWKFGGTIDHTCDKILAINREGNKGISGSGLLAVMGQTYTAYGVAAGSAFWECTLCLNNCLRFCRITQSKYADIGSYIVRRQLILDRRGA